MDRTATPIAIRPPCSSSRSRQGSNALTASNAVKATIAELAKSFPKGLEYRITYNPTEFIEVSIKELYHSIIEAVLLVVLVVLLFLQTWRATIIPVAAIPISLIGTFAVMQAFGFSLNMLTLVRPRAGGRHRGR